MGMKRCLFCAGVVLAWAGGAFAEIAWEPAVPPPDWEKHITPGFDPDIESVLVEWGQTPPHEWDEQTVHEQMQAWGSQAVPVLAKLYADDGWKDFRSFIVKFMAVSGLPEALAWLKQRYTETVEAQERPDSWRHQVYSLSYTLAQTGSEDLIDLLIEQALNGKSDVQQAAVSALSSVPSEKVLQVYRELASRDEQNEWMKQELSNMEGRVRAQQPVSVVLEKEKAQ